MTNEELESRIKELERQLKIFKKMFFDHRHETLFEEPYRWVKASSRNDEWYRQMMRESDFDRVIE